jgi:regulator of replication initiation timing
MDGMNNLFGRIKRAVTACLLTVSAASLGIGGAALARAAGYGEVSVPEYTHFLLAASGKDSSPNKVVGALIALMLAFVVFVIWYSIKINRSENVGKRKGKPSDVNKITVEKRKQPQFVEKRTEEKTDATASPTADTPAQKAQVHKTEPPRANVSLGSSREIDRLNRRIEALEDEKRNLIGENENLRMRIDALKKDMESDRATRAKIANSYNAQCESIAIMKNRLAELESSLAERDDSVDAIPMVRDVLIPFVERMLLNVHLSEDKHEEDVFLQTMKNDIEELVLYSLSIDGLKLLYSEARGKGKPFDTSNAEIFPRYTDDPEKDGTLYRTLCPGLLYKGKYLLYEKVEIFRYRENVQ